MPDGFGWAPPAIDWRAPDYVAEFGRRIEALERIRAEREAAKAEERPDPLILLKRFYRDNPIAFICDWGCTYDPRNVQLGLPALLPFVLFERQVECVEYILRKWRGREPGLIEKSRDVGFTWIAIGLACTLCLHHDGMRVGVGSRKAEYVDELNSPKAILPKGRIFMRHLPVEFRGGWDERIHAPHMRMVFPESGSTIGGEAGSGIGRGDRTSIYFVDEFAHFDPSDAKGADASLLATTTCRIDASSVNGMNNAYAEKRHSGRVEPFIFDWRDDPRKDQAWYDLKKSQEDPVLFAQEIDRDYMASVEGLVIPSEWVSSIVDAHLKLNIAITGERAAAFDVADEGRDLCSVVGATGVVIEHAEEWSGKGSDIHASVERAFLFCDTHGYRKLRYDADGLGADVRGAARVINERRAKNGQPVIEVEPFRGSGEIVDPKALVEGVSDRTNEDFFANAKAQGWWGLRQRVGKTHRALTTGGKVDLAEVVSVSSQCPLWRKLTTEIAQPTRTFNGAGKLVIDKQPDETKSPNLGDATMMRFARIATGRIAITPQALRGALRR